SAATAPTPSAIAEIRSSLRANLSRSAAVSPSARPSARSAAFASSASATRSPSSRAIASSAASFASVDAPPSSRAARWAAAHVSPTVLVATAMTAKGTWEDRGVPLAQRRPVFAAPTRRETKTQRRTHQQSRGTPRSSLPPLQLNEHEPISMDHLVGRMRKPLANLRALQAENPGKLVGRVVRNAFADHLIASDDLHGIASDEVAIDRRDADGKEAGAAFTENTRSTLIDSESPSYGLGVLQPELEAGHFSKLRGEARTDRVAFRGCDQTSIFRAIADSRRNARLRGHLSRGDLAAHAT